MNIVRRLAIVTALFASCSGLGPTEPPVVEYMCTPYTPDTIMVHYPSSLRLVVGAADVVTIDYALEDGCSYQELPLTGFTASVRDTTVATSVPVGPRNTQVESRRSGRTWLVMEAEELVDSVPIVVPDTFPMGPATAVAASRQMTCAIQEGGDVMCWGSLELLVPGDDPDIGTCFGRSCSPRPKPLGRQADALSLGGQQSCFMDAAGVHCSRWGIMESFMEPGLVSLTVGNEHACGLTTTGEAYCWGANRLGQLGDDGVGVDSDAPRQVVGSHTWISIDAHEDSTCGVDGSGHLLCWGALPADITGADSCQVHAGGKNSGTTSVPCSDNPLRISLDWGLGADTLATQVEGGCVLTTSMAVHCPIQNSVRFESVATAGSFVRIWSGSAHYCGLSSGGSASCWGSNYEGQLGDRSRTYRTTPVAVFGGHTFTELALGMAHSCGIDDIGEIWCWGSNDVGESGGSILDESTIPRRVPGQDGS